MLTFVIGFSAIGSWNLIDVVKRATDPEVTGVVRTNASATRGPKSPRGRLALWAVVDFEWNGQKITRNGFVLDGLDSRYGRSLQAAESLAASLLVGQSIPVYVSRSDPRNAELFRPKSASLIGACVFLPAAYGFARVFLNAIARRRWQPSIVVAVLLLLPGAVTLVDYALGSVLSPWIGVGALGGVMVVVCLRAVSKMTKR